MKFKSKYFVDVTKNDKNSHPNFIFKTRSVEHISRFLILVTFTYYYLSILSFV